MGKIAALAILLAAILLIIALVIAQIIGKRRVLSSVTDGEEIPQNFRKWIVVHFIKLTSLGLIVANAIYVISLIPTFAPLRLVFLMISFGYPISTFLDTVVRLVRQSRPPTDLAVTVQEINRAPTTVNVDRLRAIRGRFSQNGSFRLLGRVLGVLFGLVLPLVFIFDALDGSFGAPSDPVWVLYLMAAIGVALGLFCWVAVDREWEFTGEEIIARRRNSIRWRVPISSITKTHVEITPHKTVWLHIFKLQDRYSIPVVPGLMNAVGINKSLK